MTVKKGLVFIISAPAGTGKTTLVQMLMQEFPYVKQSVSYTTRRPRPGEVEGVHYHFVSEEAFKQKIAANEFLEYVNLYGDYYGTSSKEMEEEREKGNHSVLVIDVQGALKVRGKLEAIFIFIKPPSLDALKERLSERKTEGKAEIEKRLNWAAKEIEEGRYYDYEIINDHLDKAYEALRSIVIAEEHRNRSCL